MKKIGILTFHYPNNMNFGASLQAFAVNKLFKNSKLIDFEPVKISIKSKILFYIGGRNFIEFCNKFLILTKKIKSLDELKDLNKEFDTFIVGSDQVWRPTWLEENIERYYLDFVENKNKKIAYAASFGVDYLDADKKLSEKLKKLSEKFDAISVREESGIKICKDIFGVEAVCVLDPTLMIKKEEYQRILDDWNDDEHKKNKYIAHMLLDDNLELRNESNKIARHLDSEIKYIKGKEIKILGKKITMYNKVSQWLTYLKDSELVITDSFHCTVFSLIFNKKFVVVANPNRGIARLENLLEIVGLKERFFTDIKDVLSSGVLDTEIDYNKVEEKLNIQREYSMNFIKKALGEENE